VTVRSQQTLLEDLDSRIQDRSGFTVATINLDHVVKLRRDAAFRAAYRAHSHVTADGHPIVWLSRLAGQDIDLVTGSDLVDPLAALAAERGCPVAFLGATEDVLATAAEHLEARHPGLQVVARLAPPMGFDPEGAAADAMIEDLGSSGARICLLALGAPKQEILAARAARILPEMGFVSIGAGLDFVAGTQRRAPKLIRALAAEWLWRLANQPRRMAGRYAACVEILPGLIGRAVVKRFSRQGETRNAVG
jgi:exopolysaccharide biosynthesis WecB/TagA/CpsF family protein